MQVYDNNGTPHQSLAHTQLFGQASVDVVTGVSYLPFGPISSYTLGNGQAVTRTYDANYALTDVTSPALALHFARDAMGNITALGATPGASPATETYTYDPLYRLTGVQDASGTGDTTGGIRCQRHHGLGVAVCGQSVWGAATHVQWLYAQSALSGALFRCRVGDKLQLLPDL